MLDGVKVRYFASNMLRRLSYAPSLAQALQREVKGADIVHLHSVFLWPTWRAASDRTQRAGAVCRLAARHAGQATDRKAATV